jgi:ubiquinol-cytochrome c reductase cytochrome c1 subunit
MIKLARLIFVFMTFPVAAMAAGGSVDLPHQHWHFDGVTGTYDQASMQRGLKVYREVCSACHGLDRVYFRNLEALGYEEGQIKNIASEYTVMDGPNDEGEMFERTGRPSDRFPNPFVNKQAATAANGAYPPDLSLIAKARPHGPDYLYALLTGYEDVSLHADVPEGKYWNKYFPGHIISMAPPLMEGQVAYEDGTPMTVEQYAYDLANFLKWAADPFMEERKRTGIKVILFLLAFAGIMYAYKKKIWADAH